MKVNSKIRQVAFWGMVSFMIVSCKTKQVEVKSTVPQVSTSRTTFQTPGILFVDGYVVLDSVRNIHRIGIISMKRAEGSPDRLRRRSQDSQNADYTCEIIDEHELSLGTYPIENPLVNEYELASEDGTLEHKVVRTDSASFFLRVPYENNAQSLRFRYRQQALLMVDIKTEE